MGYCFRLTARVLLYALSHRQDSTYHSLCCTSRGALAGTRSSSMGPPWRIDPTIHRTIFLFTNNELWRRAINQKELTGIWITRYYIMSLMTAYTILTEKKKRKLKKVYDLVISAFTLKKLKINCGLWIWNSSDRGSVKVIRDTILRFVVLNECNFHLQSIFT